MKAKKFKRVEGQWRAGVGCGCSAAHYTGDATPVNEALFLVYIRPLVRTWTGLNDVKYQFLPAMIILDLEQADYDVLKTDEAFRAPETFELDSLYGYQSKQQ